MAVCPTDAIHEINFPLKKLKPTEPKTATKTTPKKEKVEATINLTANLEVKPKGEEKTASAIEEKADTAASNNEEKA